MSAKYSLASNTTAGDRLLWNSQNAIHLSTGDAVFLVADPSQANPSKVSLVCVTGAARGTQTTISIIGGVTTGTGAFDLDYNLPQCLALCRDASDNLYVIGASGSASTTLIRYQAFVKQAGLVWQPSVANVCLTPASATLPPVGYVALWCNTGGGGRYPAVTGSPAGHVIVAATTNDGTVTNACFILAAAPMLAGAVQYGTVVVNPAFIGDSNTLYGSNIDISQDGFGATSGLCVSAVGINTVQIAGWGVSSTGALTTGNGLLTSMATGTLTTTTKLRIVRYAPASWLFGFPSSTNAGQISLSAAGSFGAPLTSIDTGTTSSFPAPSATLSWDLSVDPQGTVWVYGWSSGTATTMLRRGVVGPSGFGTPTLGSVVSDDTSLGATNSTIRAVKEPVDWFHTDWQAYVDVSGTYSLLGDFSALPVQPYLPTLLTPVNNAVGPLASGGTFDWAFTSPEATDAQVTYYFRRHNASGYQWWNGSSFTTAQAGATGGNEVAVTTATTQVTFGSSLWATGTWTWSVQVTGASGVVSGYAPDWTIYVAAQPATPTLTASYDSANNRTTLVVAGTSTDSAWFQYSDDGTNWFNVRGATAVVQVAGAATVYDWEIPANQTRSYRVLQWNASASPANNYSLWSTTQTATSAIVHFWLRDPQAMTVGINPNVPKGTLQTSFGEVMTEHNGLGRQDTMIVADVIGLEDGACTMWTTNATDEAALMALLKTQRTLLFETPDGRTFFVRWNMPRPVNTPYLVALNRYGDHAVTWRGQQRPPA